MCRELAVTIHWWKGRERGGEGERATILLGF